MEQIQQDKFIVPAEIDSENQISRKNGHTKENYKSLPLVLDLDGSLLKTDLLYECAAMFLKHQPWNVWKLPFWIFRSKAYLKQKLSDCAAPKIDRLPLNEAVVEYSAQEAKKGREVFVATAANSHLARLVAARLNFVREVIASDEHTNMKGRTKAEKLKERFPGGFEYVGDSDADIPIVEAATRVRLVSPTTRLRKAAEVGGNVDGVFPASSVGGARLALKVLRAHQWAKNSLIFVPLVLGGMATDPVAWAKAMAGFLAISLLASTTYLLNDLWDLDSDREHWSKRKRPLASGDLSIATALMLIPIGLGVSLAMGMALGAPVFGCMIVYLATTIAYSIHLKRVAFLDTLTLATLFTLRLALGVVLVGVVASPWLFVFSMFLFVSLSIAKRHTEVLRSIAKNTNASLASRGYRQGDETLLVAFGSAAGLAATLVMVLYLTNDAFNAEFYTFPALLWGLPPILFTWISRIWLVSQRGELNDDPVVFALKDRASLCLGGIMGLLFAGAWLGGHLL